jgi:hypothetical protein
MFVVAMVREEGRLAPTGRCTRQMVDTGIYTFFLHYVGELMVSNGSEQRDVTNFIDDQTNQNVHNFFCGFLCTAARLQEEEPSGRRLAEGSHRSWVHHREHLKEGGAWRGGPGLARLVA